MDAEGWVPLPEFLASLDLDASEDAIRDVVRDCPKVLPCKMILPSRSV